MTKRKMIELYRQYSKAESYIIGFIYKHNLYAIEIAEIMPRHIQVLHTSQRNGKKAKLQLVLNNKLKEQFIRKGAICLGNETILEGRYNKGVEFERLIYNLNNQEFRGKDNVGFWLGGDIELNGKQVQIKLQGAQIALENTLQKLHKGIIKS